MYNFLKNTFAKIIKLFFFFISPIILLIILIIFPFKKIRIGSLPTHRIGHLSQETELYLSSTTLPSGLLIEIVSVKKFEPSRNRT